MADPLFKLARKIRAVEKLAFRAATQPQLAYSSIEDGAIQSVEDGTLKAIIGKQFDGTQAVAIVNGPPPPQPNAPGALPALEGAVICWDGTFADGSVVPMEFARVEAHVSTDPDFTAEFAATLKATFESPRGGQVFISLVPATYYVKLVARNSSGGRSVISAATTVVPQALSASLPDASDGIAPASSPTPLVEGGIQSLFIGWDRVANADPVTYEVHVSDTSSFTPDATTLSGETEGTLHVIRTLPGDTTRLDHATPYYVRIIARDVDGAAAPSAQASGQPMQIDTVDIADGSITEVTIADDAITSPKILAESVVAGKIAANAITSGTIAAGAVTADKVFANAITADKLATLLVLASRIEVGSAISIDPATGITINLANGGYIKLPANGTPAEFKRVILQATELVVEDKLTINGIDNKVAGALTLNQSVSVPSIAPTVTNLPDQSPITTSATAANSGMGLSASAGKYLTAEFSQWVITSTVADSQSGNWDVKARFAVYSIDKATGAKALVRTHDVHVYYTDKRSFDPVPATPPTPTILNGYLTDSTTILSVYFPAYSHAGYVDNGTGTGALTWGTKTEPAMWRYPYSNPAYNSGNATVLVMSGNNGQPSWYTDDTNLYLAYVTTANKMTVERYTMAVASGVTLMTSTDTITGDMISLFVGNADFGASRYVVTSATQAYVFNGATQETTKNWTMPESIKGMAYDSGRFRALGASNKVWKFSTIVAATSHSFTYTWYNATGGAESTPSPASTVGQNARAWIQVTTSAIPTGTTTDYPDSVRLYDSNKRQAALGVGVLTTIYETTTNTGAAAPTVDGYAALGNAGTVKSSKADSRGSIILLKGDGSGRAGPLSWGATGARTNWPAVTQPMWNGGAFTVGGPGVDSGPVGDAINFVVNSTQDLFLVTFTAVGISPGGTVNFFTINIDGVAQQGRTHSPADGSYWTVSRTVTVTGLSPGTHTFTVHSWNNANSVTTNVFADSSMALARIM